MGVTGGDDIVGLPKGWAAPLSWESRSRKMGVVAERLCARRMRLGRSREQKSKAGRAALFFFFFLFKGRERP